MERVKSVKRVSDSVSAVSEVPPVLRVHVGKGERKRKMCHVPCLDVCLVVARVNVGNGHEPARAAKVEVVFQF